MPFHHCERTELEEAVTTLLFVVSELFLNELTAMGVWTITVFSGLLCQKMLLHYQIPQLQSFWVINCQFLKSFFRYFEWAAGALHTDNFFFSNLPFHVFLQTLNAKNMLALEEHPFRVST